MIIMLNHCVKCPSNNGPFSDVTGHADKESSKISINASNISGQLHKRSITTASFQYKIQIKQYNFAFEESHPKLERREQQCLTQSEMFK